jgi:hypothetical protein
MGPDPSAAFSVSKHERAASTTPLLLIEIGLSGSPRIVMSWLNARNDPLPLAADCLRESQYAAYLES